MSKTRTRGNVIVEDIKVGDIHYEYEMGLVIKTEVIEDPVWVEEENRTGWEWKSKKLNNDKVITYFIDPRYSHYSSKLYDYEAYSGAREI